MKKLLLFLCSALIIGFISCSSEEPFIDDDINSGIPTKLDISQNQLSFSKDGGENIINITSDGKWILTNNDDWCLISPKTGNGNAQIKITLKTNTSDKERLTEIILKGGNLSQKITVSQDPSTSTSKPEVPIKIHVEKAGTLKELIGSRLNQIENLLLTGSLNGTDIKTIRSMEKLSVIDLSNANIVSGGDSYNIDGNGNYCYTSNNIISSSMFSDKMNLISITLPNNITRIGHGAFWGCSKLTSIIIPNKVEIIEYGAFGECSSLNSIVLSNSLKEIKDWAFARCYGLKSISLPNSLIKIERPFLECTSLSSITIPSSLIEILSGAFRNCTQLKEFIVEKDNPNFSSTNGVLCNKDKTILIAYPNAKGTTYIIPNSILRIEDSAFFNCHNLKSITITENIRSIGLNSFLDCPNLKDIHVKSKIPPKVIEEYYNELWHAVFDKEINLSATLYVPKGKYNDYWIAPIWRDFKNIKEE
ncbi:MAG: leucine-rich repeat protein [Dysgonomonas sp.]|nr:leucine-rich repeat protein [Dysgonomonas sp.]